MLTKTIRDGTVTVLAKETKYGLASITYANEKQARNMVARLRTVGVECFVMATNRPYRPYYVAIGSGR